MNRYNFEHITQPTLGQEDFDAAHEMWLAGEDYNTVCDRLVNWAMQYRYEQAAEEATALMFERMGY